MTKNPLINAGAAAIYIGAIVLLLNGMSRFDGQPETLLIPLAMITLLVFSVLVMSYCFFFTPIQMYLDGEKREAVDLFSRSMLCFGGIAVLFWAVLLWSYFVGL